METNIAKMYKLQEQINTIQEECDSIGKDTFGDSYEDCYQTGNTLTIWEDSGHESDSEEYYFDSDGYEQDRE